MLRFRLRFSMETACWWPVMELGWGSTSSLCFLISQYLWLWYPIRPTSAFGIHCLIVDSPFFSGRFQSGLISGETSWPQLLICGVHRARYSLPFYFTPTRNRWVRSSACLGSRINWYISCVSWPWSAEQCEQVLTLCMETCVRLEGVEQTQAQS